MGEEITAAGCALPGLHVGQHTRWAFCKARVSQGSGLLQVIHVLSLSVLLPSLSLLSPKSPGLCFELVPLFMQQILQFLPKIPSNYLN